MDSRKLLKLALNKGGDYADLFMEQSIYNSIRLQDGAVNAAECIRKEV